MILERESGSISKSIYLVPQGRDSGLPIVVCSDYDQEEEQVLSSETDLDDKVDLD